MTVLRNALGSFDGISCAQVALERAGIELEGTYYASEIDEYAITVANKNYPDTVQLGDIKDWRDWDLEDVDLITGGSPCQGFSIAGKRLNFKDPRSTLFFHFVDILNHYNPKYWLLENVKMRKDIEVAISTMLGCEPVVINSGLVSAQNRERLYWTNIPITQPEDKGIVFNDIMIPNLPPTGELREYFEEKEGVYSPKGMCHIGSADIRGIDSLKRVYCPTGKMATLTTSQGGHREGKVSLSDAEWRKVTPLEAERLQTLPDNYTEGLSNSQRYKMVGNGWTVDVIAHILSGIET